MALSVTERQKTERWYELYGHLEARELFPKLLPNSDSVMEMDEEIPTEPELVESGYDGCPAEHRRMANEIAKFNESAIAKFRDEALPAANAMLTGLVAGQTLLRRDFKEIEKTFLEEAAKELAISIPWDAAEAAQMAADEAAKEAAKEAFRKRMLEEDERRKQEIAEVLEKARSLFMAGNSHTAVRGMFPNYAGQIGGLVGELRRQGVQIPR